MSLYRLSNRGPSYSYGKCFFVAVSILKTGCGVLQKELKIVTPLFKLLETIISISTISSSNISLLLTHEE
jgi:hypothetical protein